MIAEQLLLRISAVDIEQERILVERNLRGDAQHDILPREGSAVHLVVRQFAFCSVCQYILEVFQISGEIVTEFS